ncbi:MAG: hypothetical protein J6Y91_00170, partial [Alphaproteobacteria bacterium]|nr:hypothetical protein [Alphaproteobacteria bacterium]
MKRLLKGLVLGLAVNTFCIGCLCAKVCFLPIGGCEEEWYKMPVDENSISCSPGYSSTVTSCSGNFTLVTEEVIGGTCGKCECNLSCSGHEDLNLTTCTCENTLCPLGTSMSCVDDACYDCEYKETLPDGTRCYKNTRKQATCPPDYTTSKPSARCLLSQKQTCGDNTCYKEKICSNEDEELDENCNCVPANKNECPYGYSDKQNHKCDDVIEKGELKCYKSKTCDVGYKLDEETCECKPYCEEPYSLEATNKCDDYIMFGDHKCYKEKKCTQQYYSLNPDTCECECDEELIEDNGEEKCVDCDDGGHNPCTEKGYKLCREEDFLIGEGSVVCTCGDEEYYERCSTLEQCYVDQDAVLGTIDGCHQELSINSTSKYHDAANNAYVSIGRYFVKNKCQKVDLSWIIHTAECNTQKDCNGNAGPAYGKIDTAECVGNVGEGTVSCGGADYATSCKCPYKKNANISANGGSCSYFDESSLPLAGYYKVEGYDCTAGGETYVGVASCLASVDCKGNPGPAYGTMKESQ